MMLQAYEEEKVIPSRVATVKNEKIYYLMVRPRPVVRWSEHAWSAPAQPTDAPHAPSPKLKYNSRSSSVSKETRVAFTAQSL